MTDTDTKVPETSAETPAETPKVVPDEANLNDLGRMILATIREQAQGFNAAQAQYDAATGDRSKAVHDLREASDDPKVLKFRKWLEDFDKKREQAVKDIDAHITANLMPAADLSEEDAAKLKETLTEQRKEIKAGVDYWLSLPAVKSLEGHENLLPEIKGARKGVSKGTGSGAPKPRVKAVYVDGVLCSHEVKDKENKISTKSSFTDAVKYLSDKHDVKVETKDLHREYFTEAKVEPKDWADGPDSVEFIFHVTDKAGASHNHKVLVTK